MRTFLTILACLFITTSAFSGTGNKITIRNNPGGAIDEVIAEIVAFKRAGGTDVVIDGMCASACIFWLHKNFGFNICATPRAKLGMHVPYDIEIYTGAIVFNEELHKRNLGVADLMISGLPQGLKNKWTKEKIPDVYFGAKTSDLNWVKGKEAVKYVGKCK